MRYIRSGIVVLFAAALALWLAVNVLMVRGKDTTPPVITSTAEEIELSVSDAEEEILKGLTASDDVDGDLTDKIRVGTHSKFIHPGVCEVSYLVFDSSYNVGQYTRRVTYTDYVSPRFTLKAPLIYQVGSTVSLMSRVSAVDVLDGEIDGKIKIISSNVNSEKEGIYSAQFEVTNEYADVVTLTLPVHIVEAQSDVSEDVPQIVLNSYLIYLKKGEQFQPKDFLKEVNETEEKKGSISRVKIENGVDTSEEGVYEVTYTYRSTGGNTGTTYLAVVVTE